MTKMHRLLAITSVTTLIWSFPALAQSAPATDDAKDNDIVVTATRRSESVLDIPYNITAISGEDLAAQGITNISALRSAVPGLTAPDYGVRGNGINNAFIIRGVNTDQAGGPTATFPKLQNSSTSTYIDEIPLFANLQLTDIDRVEVLRGPQGTLFGAGSVGGTIRIIRKRPEFGKFDYVINGELAGTDHSGSASYNGDAVINLPIGERIAVRVSGGYTKTAGVTDGIGAFLLDANGEAALARPTDPVNSSFVIAPTIADIDDSETWFVRGAVRWKASEAIDIEASYQHQNDNAGAFNVQTPGLQYQTRKRYPTENLETNTDLAALTVTADIGFATVTSASSYFHVSTEDVTDGSGIVQTFAAYYGFYPRLFSPAPDSIRQRSFSQELRLVSNGDGPLKYIVGGYYQNQRADYSQYFSVPGFTRWARLPGSAVAAEDYFGVPRGTYPNFSDFVADYFGGIRPENAPRRDEVYNFSRTVRQQDYAGFGEITYNITPRWSITGGARFFWQQNSQDTVALLLLANIGSGGVSRTTLNDHIFKANTSYKLGDDLLSYFTFSQGFRSGGANSIRPCPTATSTRCDPAALASYRPDTANNYELGIKGKIFDRRLAFTLAAFQLDWDDIQVERGAFDGTPIIVNGKTAQSRGIEFAGQAQIAKGLSFSAGYSFTDAKLTSDFTSGGAGGFIGANGARLPGISQHQVNGAADFQTTLRAGLSGFAHADVSWRSSFDNTVDKTVDTYRRLDGYAIVRASIGVEFDGRYRLSLFANNLFNKAGISGFGGGGGQAAGPVVRAFNAVEFYSRPRTVGLRFSIHK